MKPNTRTIMADDIAAHGADKALILFDLRYWLNHNKDNGKHLHDGYYWAYNSAKGWAANHHYFTPNKIDKLLRQLEKSGVILTGNYNRNRFDRTKWYSMPEFASTQENPETTDPAKRRIAFSQTAESESANRRNQNQPNGGIRISQSAEPIPDIDPNTDPDKDIKGSGKKDPAAQAQPIRSADRGAGAVTGDQDQNRTQGPNGEPPNRQNGSEKPQTGTNAQTPPEERQQGAAKEPEKKAKRQRATPTQLREDWQPTTSRAWAQKNGIPEAEIENALFEFKIYWIEAGNKKASWDATFINRLKALITYGEIELNEQASPPLQRLANQRAALNNSHWPKGEVTGLRLGKEHEGLETASQGNPKHATKPKTAWQQEQDAYEAELAAMERDYGFKW